MLLGVGAETLPQQFGCRHRNLQLTVHFEPAHSLYYTHCTAVTVLRPLCCRPLHAGGGARIACTGPGREHKHLRGVCVGTTEATGRRWWGREVCCPVFVLLFLNPFPNEKALAVTLKPQGEGERDGHRGLTRFWDAASAVLWGGHLHKVPTSLFNRFCPFLPISAPYRHTLPSPS